LQDGVNHVSGGCRDQSLIRDPGFDISILDNRRYVGP